MTCPDEYRLSLFASGDLSKRQTHRIEQHLHGCPVCRKAVNEFQLLRSAVSDSGTPIPPHVRSTLATQVLSRIALEQGHPSQLSIWNRLRWGIAAVATACLSIAIWGSLPEQHSLDLPLSALVPARPPAQAFIPSRPLQQGSPASLSPPSMPETATERLNPLKLSLISDLVDEDKDAVFRIPSRNPSIEIHWLMD